MSWSTSPAGGDNVTTGLFGLLRPAQYLTSDTKHIYCTYVFCEKKVVHIYFNKPFVICANTLSTIIYRLQKTTTIHLQANLPVLYTCSSSTIPSFPPPNTTISSFIATALCPCLGRGTGPDHPRTLFHRGCRTDAVVPITAEPGADISAGGNIKKEHFHSLKLLFNFNNVVIFKNATAACYRAKHRNHFSCF